MLSSVLALFMPIQFSLVLLSISLINSSEFKTHLSEGIAFPSPICLKAGVGISRVNVKCSLLRPIAAFIVSQRV